MITRAFWRATKVEKAKPPYDTIYLKIFYPASLSNCEEEKDLGVVPPASEKAPFPIVIFFNGVNISLASYQWLADKLTEQGLVVVLFDWIAENIPGNIGITPGVDLEMWKPENYGRGPTASALPYLIAELEHLNTDSILAGMLDLDKIILGGHSAGGRVALESADPDYFPHLVAAFGYGVHAAVPVSVGCQPGTIRPLPNALPLLLMGGTEDGVILNSGYRYGLERWETPATPILRTFSEAMCREKNDSYLVIFQGANHFSVVSPFDPTTGRAFLDLPATQPEDKIRSLMAEIISLFIDAHVRSSAEAVAKLSQMLEIDNPSIATFQRQ